MKYTASKQLIRKIIIKEEKTHGIKVNINPVNNLENILNIIDETIKAKQKNKAINRIECIKIILEEIIDQKNDLGFYDIDNQELKIRLSNIKETRKEKDQYLWALLRTIYHECHHAIFYQKIIPKDEISQFKMSLDYILAEISNYYKTNHDDFYIEILANNYSIEKTINFIKKYPDIYQELIHQINSTKLLFEIYSQNYDPHQTINHITTILKKEDLETKNKYFETNEYLSLLFTKEGNIKLDNIDNQELTYIIVSSKSYLDNIDINNQTTKELQFILESLNYTYNIDKERIIKNTELKNELEELKIELTKINSNFICDDYLIPLLNRKQQRFYNKIKYLELQIKRINKVLQTKENNKVLTRKI